MGTALSAFGPLELLLLACATWRVAHMIALEHGPFKCFVWLRAVAPLGGVTTCEYCLTVWVAPAMVLCLVYAPLVVWALAVSGAALMLKAYTGAGR